MVCNLIRYAYVPLLLVGINGAGIALVAAGASKLWLLALLVAAIGASFASERLLPYRQEWNTPAGDGGRDTAHALVNETLLLFSRATIPVLAALVTVADLWPHGWPFVFQVILAVAAVDLGTTLVHFASHKVGFLWRFHAVHHSVKRFYGFNGLMKHPVHQTIELTAGVAPLLVVGLPVDVAAALTLTVAVQLLLQHSNTDYRVGVLGYVLSLNEGHRFHHLKWAGIGDVNFGLYTLVWDRMLGTYMRNSDRRFTSDDIGIAAKPHYPNGYLAQLAEPFRARGACAAGTEGAARSGEHQANWDQESSV
ncbi:sterol desaturase family protein [Streptomyces sp. NPDC006251]|uniref:sterol desaturase family protein n=1 Tax=Streptomyces sp. NPDC006251 TaxID=3155718 RepID=UPI0033A4D377